MTVKLEENKTDRFCSKNRIRNTTEKRDITQARKRPLFVEFRVIGLAFSIVAIRMPPDHFGQALMVHDLRIDFPMRAKDITELVAGNQVYIV